MWRTLTCIVLCVLDLYYGASQVEHPGGSLALVFVCRVLSVMLERRSMLFRPRMEAGQEAVPWSLPPRCWWLLWVLQLLLQLSLEGNLLPQPSSAHCRLPHSAVSHNSDSHTWLRVLPRGIHLQL